MATKATNQITISDITDAYSVILTSEAYTFVGNTSGAASGSTCSTQAVAYCGGSQKSVSVDQAAITCPSGISASVSISGTPAVATITFTLSSTLSTAAEATIPVVVDGLTINKKFSFAVAKTGQTGAAGADGKTWASGTAITGTAATGNTGYAGKVGDQYLNTNTWNVYTCATAGTSSTAQWNKTGNIKGGTGAAGSKWYEGSGAPSASTVTSAAAVNDQYLNTSNGDVYKCTTAGTPGSWTKTGNIKGATGDTGPQGPQGDAGEDAILLCISTDNGDVFKNSTGNTILTPEVYVGGVQITVGAASTAGKFPVVINGTTYYLYWYRGDTKLDSSNTGSTSTKFGEFVTGTPNGRLKVYAIQVNNKQPYTCKLEDA